MIRPPARASRNRAPKALHWRSLTRREMSEPLTVVLKWRGGPEAWVEIRARGCVVRVTGDKAIAELVMMLNGQY